MPRDWFAAFARDPDYDVDQKLGATRATRATKLPSVCSQTFLPVAQTTEDDCDDRATRATDTAVFQGPTNPSEKPLENVAHVAHGVTPEGNTPTASKIKQKQYLNPDVALVAHVAHKSDGLLGDTCLNEQWTYEDWQAFYDERAREACITEWLNRNPAPSEPGSCAHCGRAEQAGAMVVPFGVKKNTSIRTWLHPECYPVWRRERRQTAEEYLISIGVWDHD